MVTDKDGNILEPGSTSTITSGVIVSIPETPYQYSIQINDLGFGRLKNGKIEVILASTEDFVPQKMTIKAVDPFGTETSWVWNFVWGA